ncbi:MAG: hypothetical protein WEB31_07875 [Chthoniobacterales bacterium]
MSTAAFWWNAAGLFLLILWSIQRLGRGGRWFLLAALGAAAVSAIPFSGHVPRYWLSGLTPNLSVPLFALLAVSIVQRAGGGTIFRPREWQTAWIFGAVASFALYPSALGLGWRNFDTYSLGWPWLEWARSLLLFGPVAALSALLTWRGNRFGWVLAASSAAFLFGGQESHNFWDYVLDPLYGAVSLVAVAVLAARRLTRR